MSQKLARGSSGSTEAATKIFSQRKQNSLISAKIDQMEISTILTKMAHKRNFRKFPNLQMTSKSSQNELWRCSRVQNGSHGSKECKCIIFRPIPAIFSAESADIDDSISGRSGRDRPKNKMFIFFGPRRPILHPRSPP